MSSGNQMIKRKLKARKKVPHFRREESWRYKSLRESWRKPKGLDSKMRQERKGWPSRVKVGYGIPKGIRGLHPSGLKPVMVHNMKALEQLANQEGIIIVISARMGDRQKKLMTERARNMGLRISNPFREEVFE